MAKLKKSNSFGTVQKFRDRILTGSWFNEIQDLFNAQFHEISSHPIDTMTAILQRKHAVHLDVRDDSSALNHKVGIK